jgi:hypothetical protein
MSAMRWARRDRAAVHRAGSPEGPEFIRLHTPRVQDWIAPSVAAPEPRQGSESDAHLASVG